MKVKRGDIVYISRENEDLGVQKSTRRPYVVVSNDVGNKFSSIAMVVPLTSKLKKLTQPTHAVIKFNQSMALCEQIITVNQDDIYKIRASLNRYQMKRIDECLKEALDIE